MAWKPIADRIAGLPLVIAGPILRRVEKDNMSVWLALKEPCLLKDGKQLTLTVYNSGTGSSRGTFVMKGSRDTVSLGEHLHIVVLTAKASGILLQPGITYSYNVTGNGLDFTANAANPANYAICYPGFDLPTFSLPPADLNTLRIIHASCRKLHAQGTDALADVDTLLYDASRIPATLPSSRPHQLFLTGDQIYADDVDGLLLFLVRDLCEGADAALDIDTSTPRTTAKGLLNWTEVLRGGTRYSDRGRPHIAAGYPLSNIEEYNGLLEVGRRSELLRKESGLHFPGEWEVPENHLIKLGEYYAMYLLMWSPLLWPNDAEYPAYRNVYSKKYFSDDPQPFQQPVGSDEEIAEASAESGGDKLNYSIFSRSVTRAKLYQDELRAVRRALANIPTYMICDDHEITDDWFLDYNWCETVLSQALGNRIVQNGLTAYTLFQGWGNNPAQFEQPTGQQLLTFIEHWSGTDNYDTYDSNNIGAWNTIGAYIGMPALYETLDQHRLIPQISNRLQHHFYIAWDKHEVLVLDTRTYRDFPGSSSDYAALISRESLANQLGNFAYSSSNTIEVTFIVIATPISGVPNLEEALQSSARTAAALKIGYKEHLSGLPISGIGSISGLVSENDRSYFTDAEGYAYQQKGLQDLYAGICRGVAARQQFDQNAQPGRVVVLSGDVHYGFTNRVEFWADRFADMAETDGSNNGATHFVLAQLCASALKNEKDGLIGNESQHLPQLAIANSGSYGYRSVDDIGYTKDEITKPFVWLGWVPPLQGYKKVGEWHLASKLINKVYASMMINKYNPVLHVNKSSILISDTSVQPDWMYRINYIKSLKPPVNPQQVLAVSSPFTGPAATPQQRATAMKNYVAACENNRKYLLKDSPGSEAVGKNNFGEVTFDWGSTEETKFVRHYLWWSETFNGIDAQRQPHSKFAVLLGKDDAKYPKPTAPYTT
jgi:hypothetical protein